MPLVAQPGTVAMLSTPDGLDGPAALNSGNKYPHWRQVVAARRRFVSPSTAPARAASRVQCPLLVLVCDQD